MNISHLKYYYERTLVGLSDPISICSKSNKICDISLQGCRMRIRVCPLNMRARNIKIIII